MVPTFKQVLQLCVTACLIVDARQASAVTYAITPAGGNSFAATGKSSSIVYADESSPNTSAPAGVSGIGASPLTAVASLGYGTGGAVTFEARVNSINIAGTGTAGTVSCWIQVNGTGASINNKYTFFNQASLGYRSSTVLNSAT